MDARDLIEIIINGEDSRYEFKSKAVGEDRLAQEMIAFSNTNGGKILIGVKDDGELEGLTQKDIDSLNQLVPNVASNNILPPIIVDIQNITLSERLVMVVSVPKGNRPRMNSNAFFYKRNGASSQKIRSPEEVLRLFQNFALVQADKTPVEHTTVADIDEDFFEIYYRKEHGKSTKDEDISFPQLLENMRLAKNGELNYASILLFGLRPQSWLPVFNVKAVAFPSEDIEDVNYLDSKDIEGKLSDIFQQALSFVLANIKHVQNRRGFNSIGEPEIPRLVFEELITNALIHRDYFVSAPVKVLVFSNRIEIISPGHLPNNLTTDNIKMGVSNIRNPILHSFATKLLLPYRGLGSGILRAISAYPKIEFLDDRDGNTFRVTILRESSI